MPAELRVTESDDGRTLLLAGELDTHTAPQLDRRLQAVADGTDLVLDLSETTFISSAGLGVILETQRRLAASGGSLQVSSPTPVVARMIELSGLSQSLGIS